MKPCAHHQKPLAWLALDVLDADSAAKLRVHLGVCAGCRQYWDEVSKLCREQAEASEAFPRIPADESFHRRLKQRIVSNPPRASWWRAMDGFVHGIVLQTRQPLTLAAVLTVALAAALLRWDRPHQPPTPSPVTGSAPMRDHQTFDAPPTLAVYRTTANDSMEALDDLLSRQAAHGGVGDDPRPLHRAGRLDWEN